MTINLANVKVDILAASGQANPVNSVNSDACYGSGTHPSGYPQLNNISGTYAWRYKGNADGSLAVYNSTNSAGVQWTPDLSGTTDQLVVAVRLRTHVAKAGGSDFNSLFNLADTLNSGDGAYITATSSKWFAGWATDLGDASGVTFTTDVFKTLVFRVTGSPTFNAKKFELWYEGGGGTSAPDVTDAVGNAAGVLMSILMKKIASLGGEAEHDIIREWVYRGTLTDAECRSLATDLNGTIAAAGAVTSTLNGTLDTIIGSVTAGAAAITATVNGALDSITGNLAAGGVTGRLTSQLPLRNAARVVLSDRSDVAVHIMVKPGLASAIVLAGQSIVSGFWTAAGPFTPGLRYNVMYEVAGESIGCEIITAAAP